MTILRFFDSPEQGSDQGDVMLFMVSPQQLRRSRKRNMIRRVFALATVVFANGADAQTSAPNPPPRPPAQTSAYCLSVSAGFLESETKALKEMLKCGRGDTIVIPARNASSVARMCDFSKTIVAAGENIVCTMISAERATK
jgi:hypothetical protein